MSIDSPLSLFGLATTPLELISFLLSVMTVWLNIRQNHWAWLFSILASLLYAVVFVDARIYGDAGLQFVFVAVSVWGWYQWLRGGTGHRPLSVSHLDRTGWIWMLSAWGVGFLLLSSTLRMLTDTDVPHADAFLTAGSLVGQFLLSRKKVENWLVWIVVDVLYVGLYVYKHLLLTGALYALFVVMAYAGWRGWLRSEKQSREQVPA